jgi:hypothetical protein
MMRSFDVRGAQERSKLKNVRMNNNRDWATKRARISQPKK